MQQLTKDTHIALLMGGPGAEREVSLVSAKSVLDALHNAGFTNVTPVDVTGTTVTLPKGTQLAFNMIHGTFGEDGQVQDALNKLGVPYTGARAESSRNCFNKALTKRVFLAAGVPTPRAEELDCSKGIQMPTIPVPLVIKPAREGSSVGVHIVRDAKDLKPALEEAASHDSLLLVEEFIDGKELTVGILDGKPLPVIHICPRTGFYDLSNKYPWMNKGGATDYICPADISDEDAAAVQKAAKQAYEAAHVEVYGRVDVMLRNSDHKPFVIEINTIPGMTPSSLLPKAAKQVGWSYEDLCGEIARLSLSQPLG